mgnify:CR=1 FL=1
MAHLTQAQFHGQNLNIIEHQNQQWLTAEQVGLALGYRNSNARKGISKLYNNHADEFNEDDTCVVNLATQGQRRQTRIFSATGCQLLGFFANTPKAKAFRSWAKKTLVNTPEAQGLGIPSYVRKELLCSRPLWANIQRYYHMGLSQSEIAKLVGLANSTLRGHLKRMSACQLIDYQPSQHHQRIGKLGLQAQQLSLLGGKP